MSGQPFNGKAFGAQIVDTVKAYVSKTLTPIVDRLAALEKRLDALPVAKDGVGLASALIDRSGNLVLTLSDGTTRELGVVVGKDGDPGKDGRDGFSLEAFDASLADDGRTVLLSFEQDDVKFIAEMAIPTIIDRGVYKAGQEYAQGDAVTWAGSLWIAQAKTSEKPDSGQGWRLAVKRGRDGKDAAK
ncbi:hypothetical protein LUX29_18110 [Aureimonas altamirensis]|uniref:hypothetical protein n=1 Tax=Aureimonas altamirensis TaxID=370622 RepID=UPI001E5FBE02|nr:hypothetical protein [Aureimonas altamirensis]UHD44918.1 hypothetical protein LUX29_18110 [Aureimonas altamirensis]